MKLPVIAIAIIIIVAVKVRVVAGTCVGTYERGGEAQTESILYPDYVIMQLPQFLNVSLLTTLQVFP